MWIYTIEQVIIDEQPMRLVERSGFRTAMKFARPNFILKSAVTLARHIMEVFLPHYTRHIKSILAIQCLLGTLFCFTTDIWTAKHSRCYIAVTCHFIEEGGMARELLLSFVQIVHHTGKSIAQSLFDTFIEYGVAKNVLSITLDNASANTTAIKELKSLYTVNNIQLPFAGKYMHSRCLAHIINLMARDGLSLLNDELDLLRKWLKALSFPAQVALLARLKYDHPTYKFIKHGFSQDVKTRWNSTFDCLIAALDLKDLFADVERATIADANIRSLQLSTITDEGWGKVAIIADFLRPCKNITVEISRRHSPSSNLVLNAVHTLTTMLERNEVFDEIPPAEQLAVPTPISLFFNLNAGQGDSGDIVEIEENDDDSSVTPIVSATRELDANDRLTRASAEKMLTKLGKYFSEGIPDAFMLAHVLDPRFKLQYLKVIKESSDAEIALIKEMVLDTFRFFSGQDSGTNTTTSTSSAANNNNPTPMFKHQDYYAKMKIMGATVAEQNEFEKYLQDPVLSYEESTGKLYKLSKKSEKEHRCRAVALANNTVLIDDFDILKWWRITGMIRYPTVWRMARAFLAIQATSVASESTFSTSGRLITPHRCSLQPNTVSALMLLQSWLNAIKMYGWTCDDINVSLLGY